MLEAHRALGEISHAIPIHVRAVAAGGFAQHTQVAFLARAGVLIEVALVKELRGPAGQLHHVRMRAQMTDAERVEVPFPVVLEIVRVVLAQFVRRAILRVGRGQIDAGASGELALGHEAVQRIVKILGDVARAVVLDAADHSVTVLRRGRLRQAEELGAIRPALDQAYGVEGNRGRILIRAVGDLPGGLAFAVDAGGEVAIEPFIGEARRVSVAMHFAVREIVPIRCAGHGRIRH